MIEELGEGLGLLDIGRAVCELLSRVSKGKGAATTPQ